MEDIVGQKVSQVRPMTAEELAEEGWDGPPLGRPACLVLENGTVLYPSQDPEGNGPGVLFGARGKEKFVLV